MMRNIHVKNVFRFLFLPRFYVFNIFICHRFSFKKRSLKIPSRTSSSTFETTQTTNRPTFRQSQYVKSWIDVVQHNMEDLQLNVEDAENRAEWRRRNLVAGPLPKGSTA